MKLIIAGSRTITCTAEEIDHLLKFFFMKPVTEVVSGTARGMDSSGEAWAKARGIPIKRFPADWDQFGKSAGHRRNREMAEYADVLLLVWDGSSRGSAGMRDIMKHVGKVVHEATVRENV